MKPRDGTPAPFLSPLPFFLRVLAIVLLAEILVEVALEVFHSAFADATKPIVDALLLGMLIAPAVWWFVARPLRAVAMEHLRATMAVSHAADGVITVSEAGRVESFNPAAEGLFGYCKAEALGKPLTSLLPDRYREPYQRRLEQVLTSRKPELPVETRELHGLRKDGCEFPLELSLGGWRVGTQSFCTGIVRDITERKRAEEVVWRAEERYRRLFEEAPVMYVISRSGAGGPVIADCNALFLRTLGYTKVEVLGRPLADFYTHESRVKLLDMGGYQRALEGRFGVEERELLARDGRIVPILIRAVPETDPGGSVCGTRAMYLDITDRKQAEEAVRERSHQLDAARAVGSEITRELELSTLLELITRRAAELVGATSGVISLWDGEAQLLIPQAWHGFGDWMSEMSIPLGLGVTGTVAERREGMIVNDYRSSRLALAQFLERTQITAVMAEPLLYRDRLVGAITINNERVGRFFEEKDGEILRLFAAQAAIAVENARLFEAERRRATELQAVMAVSREIVGERRLEELLQEVVNQAVSLSRAHSGTLYLWDQQTQLLRPHAWVNLGDFMAGVRYVLGQGITGRAAESGPLIWNDYASHPQHDNQLLRHLPFQACIAAPLRSRDNLIGVLSLNHVPDRRFSTDDLELLKTFANQMAVAIENARLYEEAQREILERKRAEEMLRQAKDYAEKLIETANVIVLGLDAAGRVQLFNEAAERITGYTRAELAGRDYFDVFVPRDRYPHVWGAFNKLVTTGLPTFENPILTKSGEERLISWQNSEIREEGKVVGTISFGMDITERKRAEEGLRESEAKLKTLFETLLVGVSILDAERKILYANPALGRILEVSTEGLLHGDYRSRTYLRPDGTPMPAEEFASTRAIKEQRAVRNVETGVVKEDGNVIWTVVSAVPVAFPDWKVVIVTSDITDRKRAEEALRARTRQLETVRAINEEITRELDLRAVLDLITRRAVDVIGASSAMLRLWQEEAGLLVPQSLIGVRERRGGLALRLGDGVAGTVAQQRRGLLVNDFRHSPYTTLTLLESTTHIAVLSEPLLYRDRLVGVINLNREGSEPPFAEEDRQLLSLLAAQAAIAIENARLHEAVIQRAQQLATLNELSRALTTVLDRQEVVQEILAVIQILIPGAVCRVWEHVVRDGRLVLVASVGLRDPEGGQNVQLRSGEGLMGIAAATRQPVVSSDVTRDPRVINRAWAEAEGLISSLVLPLLHGDHVTGGLAISTRSPHDFTDDEVSLLQSFAAQAAIAIENARLFEEVRAGRERLEALSRRLVEVQEAERRSVSRELHDEIGQLLTGLKLVLEMGSRGRTEAMKAQLKEAQVLVSDLMERVRDLSLNLRPAMLDDLGLLPALLWHVERYSVQTHVQVDFQHSGLERRLAPEIETAVYRIVQEALTNVARHAGVQEAAVRLWADQQTLGVQIQDRGPGFDPEAVLSGMASSGLMGMRERALLLGGRFTVESSLGEGTRVQAELPI